MRNDPLRANVLSTKIISNLSPDFAKELGISSEYRSIGIITTDSDDITYTALDEATKAADVEVVYAKSFYGGASNANTKYAGEVIGILAGNSPSEVKSGMNAAVDFIEDRAYFISANEDDSVVYYAHCVSRTGSYLSEVAGIKEGEAVAYLIAPPIEAIYALDVALKAADVKMAIFYGPPSETNFGGALLTGSQSACMAACEAFSTAVQFAAENPLTL